MRFMSPGGGFADSVELMVTGDLFDERVAIVFKQDEVPHVIQKQSCLVSRKALAAGSLRKASIHHHQTGG